MFQQILNYWYELEYFSPCWPIKPKQDINILTKELPWLSPQNNPNVRISYDVYLGKAKSDDLISFLLQRLELPLDQSVIEHDNSITCICAVKIDQNGQYVANSFASINAKLSISELEQLENLADAQLLKSQENEISPPMSKNKLNNILAFVLKECQIEVSLVRPSLWARKKREYIGKKW